MSEIIKTENLQYAYPAEDGQLSVPVLKGVNLSIRRGELVAPLGHNGSGKSTLAGCFNAIRLPTGGVCYVDMMDTRDENHTYAVRKTVSMVFQNPDNQIVQNVVEEDVGFGPENLGVPTSEIWQRVGSALEKVGMSNAEVKASIQSQIRIVFFLPLVMAAVHVAAAFPMIRRLLAMLNLTNVPLFVTCLLVTILVFTAIYYLVFRITSRAYYKIVSR